MEAIKTILDIQTSPLTLVSPKGGFFLFFFRGVFPICVTMANRAYTPPHTLQVAEKGTRAGLLLAIEK